MAQTTAAALKALIESLGLGIAAYGDRPPQTDPPTPRPYVTIIEEIALAPGPLEDGGPGTAVEAAQVDLWQDWIDRDPASPTNGKTKENYTLAPALRRGIHGQRLQLVGSAVVYMVLVTSSVRLLEQDTNLVHHAITVDVHRQL